MSENMREENLELLNLRRLPARLTMEQTAPLLGFMPHDIPVLLKHGSLKALGNPSANAVKYFAAKTIEQLARDEDWLHRASKILYLYWGAKNKKRRGEIFQERIAHANN